MLRPDVCVVGAGPAGVSAATTLARAGRHVVLIDKAVFPRDKCCGDGLTTAALRQLERLGLRSEAVPSWHVVDDAWIRSPSGRQVHYPLPRGQGAFAAVAPRRELDAALVDLAREAGVKVFDGHALVAARHDGEKIVLEVEGLGGVSPSYAVGADGQWSSLAKALGVYPQGYKGEWHAFRQYVRDLASPPASGMWVFFEPEILPGYAWSFPLPGDRANVGFGMTRSDGRSIQAMKVLWPELLARPQVRAVLGPHARPEAPLRSWPIPARIDRAVLAHRSALFVGDAAQACDPMTGEGIAQALETGELAARAILAAGPARPSVAARHYRRAVHAGLVFDHRMSVALLGVLCSTKGARGAVRVSGASEWTRRNFARWMFEDEPRAAVLTPWRWHRSFLRRPGARLGLAKGV